MRLAVGIGLFLLAIAGWRMWSLELLARTAWGEARGEGVRGMQAVINVIMNRVAFGGYFGGTVPSVVLKPKQFSAWNQNDPNRARLIEVDEDNSAFRDAVQLAKAALSGQLADITRGADHYHTVDVMPSWADPARETVRIGNHIFYRLGG